MRSRDPTEIVLIPMYADRPILNTTSHWYRGTDTILRYIRTIVDNGEEYSRKEKTFLTAIHQNTTDQEVLITNYSLALRSHRRGVTKESGSDRIDDD